MPGDLVLTPGTGGRGLSPCWLPAIDKHGREGRVPAVVPYPADPEPRPMQDTGARGVVGLVAMGVPHAR